MAISFVAAGTFSGVQGGSSVLSSPTSLQFGPDGRLYVSEQNGDINAFTVSLSNGQYVATDHELLTLPGGGGVVKSIQNHNDDGSESSQTNRQVTGLVVTGTAENPVLYISSSDPRISTNSDANLDTNSGVITRVTWTGTEWEAVDILRGLPRSEENHSNNGLAFNPLDPTKLYVMVGGNTNNGAPSSFFSYTGEYALSGTLLEIDLTDIESRPILTDPDGGQGGTPRQYIYDLPTLDDPNTPNVTDGVGEDANGMDEAGPWGGRDGLNMAVLPADAPLRIYADGFRNAYDIAFTADGRLYTVDNGSNGNLGANPNTEAGDLDGDGISGEAINTPNNGGTGAAEPLFLIEEGGYYGHPAPIRANQNQSWTSYNNTGTPDTALSQNTVADISARVPASVQIATGFVIDPSKVAGLEGLDPNDPADLAVINQRLFESGVRIPYTSSQSPAIVTVGSSTNGIVVYDSQGQAFDGVLDGKLFVTQFNDNVTLLNLNAAGNGLAPVPTEGPDGVFGTADDGVQDADGIYFVANNSLGIPLGNPLDVTMGPNGTLWVAEIGSNKITVLAPSDIILPGDNDSDDDGILNAVDPFLRDATNGTSVTVAPGTPVVWEFSQDAGDTTPGPDGFGGGLTGHMINGTTDFEAFLQSESTRPGQNIQLDNVKFVTAAAGGTTTIEEVQNGDPFTGTNNGQFFFHTGFQLAANVDTFTVKWVVANPGAVTGGSDITNNFQQIGGYIGDGSQSNYLKIVAIATNNPTAGTPPTANIQIALEDNDTVLQTINLGANSIFNNAVLVPDSTIEFELLIDPAAATATPRATFFTTSGPVVVTGTQSIDLTGSAVLEAILGNNTVQGQTMGVAAGLFATNNGSTADTFQAVFDSITVTATEAQVAPDAVDDTVQTGVGQVLTIPVATLLANDTDANPGDTLTVTGVSNPVNGTVALNAGIVTFTPTAGFEGEASFDYTISDGTDADTATVSVTVADRVILYRVNAGGGEIASLDDGPNWSADNNPDSPNLIVAGSDSTATFNVLPGPDVPSSVPAAIYQTERWDNANAPEMQWGFDVEPGVYEVNLFMGNGFGGTSAAGARVFDVAIEGAVLPNLDNVDLSAQFGHLVGGVISNTVEVTDGTLNIEFLHGVENPLVNGIEIVQVSTSVSPPKPVVNILNAIQVVPESGQAFVSIATNITVPNGETVDVNFTIEPTGGATPGLGGDYQYVSGSATFGGGTYTDTKSIAGGSSDLQIPVSILEDLEIDPGEGFVLTINSVSPNATLGANSVATVTITDDDATVNPGEVVVRINAGGPEVLATDGGPAWSADQGQVANGSAQAGPSSPFLVDRGIDGATTATSDNVTFGDTTPNGPGVNVTGAPDALFVTERFSQQENPNNIGYAFDLANGDYIVNLYFDELFFTSAGQRVFDVEIEGTLVLDDFDTFATFGNNSGVQSIATTVSDGTLNIEFVKTATNNPHVAAIEIVAADGAPPQALVSVGAPTPEAVVEADGVTVSFPVTFDTPPSESVTIEYVVSINNVDGPTQTLVLGTADGAIVVPVPNDTIDNGDDTITVTLTAITAGDAAADIGTATASATVTEDDIAQGPVVVAINAGGPALTQNGINFSADQFFDNGTAFADGTAGNGEQPVFDGTVFETERFGGSNNGTMSYSIPVPNGDYTVELYFAEIFQAGANVGARVFDVTVEGQLVLDDFDILEQTGGDINQPIVFKVPGVVSPDGGGDDPTTIDISFSASADNAKISAIVIRDADGNVYEPPLDDLFGTAVEIADTGAAPSGPVLLAAGSNVMSATQEGDGDGLNGVRDRDYFTVEVPDGFQLTGVVLTTYANANAAAPDAFLAFQQGTTVTVDPTTGANVDDLQGAIIYGSGDVGTDLLDAMRAGFSDPQTGNSLPGFDQPLTGAWTFWLNQGAGPSTATLDFIVEPLPVVVPVEISIADASIAENGDTGTTALAFTLTADDPTFAGSVELAFQVGATPATATVDFSGGLATLTVDVPNDDLADGATIVQLSGLVVTSPSLVSVAVGADSATGTVTEDDFAPSAVTDARQTLVGTPINFDPAANDTDADTPTADLSVTEIDTSSTVGGTVILGVDGTVTVTPAAGYTGPISFGYTVTDPAGNTGQGTATVSVVEAPSTIRLQAEDLDLVDGFFAQNAGNADGQLIRVSPGDSGTASIDLTGLVPPGTYIVRTVYFDENDGESSATLQIGNFSDSWTFDNGGTGDSVQVQNIRTRSTQPIEILSGDSLIISVQADGDEMARIDYFEFEPVLPNGDNEPPFAPFGVDDLEATAGSGTQFDLAGFFADPEEDSLTFTKIGGPDWLQIAPDGTVTGTPAEGDVGTQTVAASVSDGLNVVEFNFDVIVEPDTDDRVPVMIEAEDFVLAPGGFFVENQNAASGDGQGQVIRLTQGDQGVATFTFDDTIAPGLYDVRVTYFDESDGVSEITVSSAAPGGVFAELGSWLLNSDGGGNAGQAQNIRSRTVSGLEVEPGAILRIAAAAGGEEFARIDFIELIPATSDNFAPDALGIDPIEVTGLAPFEVDLSGSFSDPEEDPLIYSIVSAPAFVSISPTGVLSVAPGAAGTFDVTIAATDGPANSGQSVEQSFQIVITDAEVPPVIETTALNAAENQTLAGTVDASDGNGDPIAFSISGTGADDALFTIDPVSGELSFIAPPDFEVPQDDGADGVYEVDVTATANGQSVTQTVAVTVTDANDAPVEAAPLGDQTATLGQPVALPSVAGVFSDQDGDPLTISASGLPDGVQLVGTSFVGTPTETGSFTVTLEADDGTDTATSTFTIEVAEDGPAASAKGYISVNAGATNLDSTSTFLANSFLLRNDSTNGELITEVQIDLDGSLLPYLGFDLGNDGDGIAYGDTANKNFTVDGGTGTATVTATSVSEPTTKFPGTQKEGGFVTLTISLANFAPGNTLSFSLDQDPPSIKNGSSSSAAQAGAIAGVEQVGATARFAFSDGSVRTVDLFTDGSPAGAEAYADGDVVAAPVLSVVGVAGLEGEVDSTTQTVSITGGPANAQAKILIVDAGAFRITNDSPDNGYVFQDYEANRAVAVQEILVTLDGNGNYTGQITLPQTPPPVGQVVDQNVVYLTAAIVGNRDADGNLEVTSLVSDKISLKIVPDDPPPPGGEVLLRINAFGPELAATDGGPNWLADTAATPSPFYQSTENRGDTDPTPATPNLPDVPNAIFTTARSDNAPFSYNIPVSALDGVEIGDIVTVNLYFAEAFDGNNTPGERIFDVTMEGALAIDNLDVAERFSGSGGVISTVVQIVGDTLNLNFINGNVDNAIVSGIEIVAGGSDPINGGTGPVDPDDALAILQSVADEVDNDGAYGAGVIGSASLRIMESIDNVQSSNFSGGSFVLENTGGKQIAAVLIDFRSALYGDSIVDPNGLGGDTTAKPFVIDGGGAATGASFDQTDAYQFPGDAPIPQPGVPSNGGFRGLLLKTDGTGFGPGETVTFSGDMDPNSIAAIAKNVVDAGAINSWDVGGVSGAELIGSSFTVMFDDGTFATGYLGSNGTQAGSVGEAVENRPAQVATVTVNGFDSSEAGTYGGAVPTIVVNGPAGATVLVTLSKGLNPVTNTANGTADLVADRLDATHPDFPVSNAADFQTFTVTLDGSGSATLPSGAFAYNAPDGGQSFSGSAFTPGFATAPIVVSASVVDGEDNPLGPVDRVYLTNPTGTPVADGGGPNPGVQGYFELVGTGTAAYFKMEIEDARIANGGTDPGGKWTFVDTAVGGNQTGFTGDGYYVYGSPANTAVNGVIGSEVLEYTIFVPQNETGTFAFQFRVSRDGVAPSDQQNDLWLNFKPASAPGAGNIENFLVGLGGSTGQEPEPTSNGYIKIFGGPNNGTWGTASNYDGLPNNPAAQISITEGGFYTIQIAGRSEGFHVDSFWLAKIGGSTPGPLSPNSPFVVTDPNAPAAPVISGGTTAIVLEGTSVALDVDATDANGDALTYSITGGADQSLFSINSTTGVVTFNTPPDFENPADSGGNNVYNIQVTVSDGALTDSENYAITVTDDPSDNPVVSGPLLTFEVLNGSTIVDGDLENGDSVNELALGDTPLFSGTLEQGEAGSVFLELLDGSGIVLDTQIENNSPFDLNYNGPAIADGNYTLRATFYAQDNLSGGIVGTQEIDFAVVDAESGPTDFRIEAEDLTLESGFGVFSQGSFTLIRLPQNNPGGPSAVASTILADVVPGFYSVRVLAYNENDGEGEFQVTVGDDVFAFVTLDESIGGNVGDSGQVGNRVLIDLGVIEIDESDEFELVYNPIGNEVGRFDYIDFIAVDDPLQN